ncbi:DUF2750 domain-containing protein [Acinetobacter zhairhuonensis]|uniref:DUF2750 domain-containing protein n=1 Tax=Acinetobacter sp. A7.4 TaxID=2919921 RepID=UPI001F503BD8|nr:DUF2750 domain-containing protein [Acinetobacter sp. A7.4]MCJ8162757.1 DUF2750 domain-containing protein [Acinetobacter sp. A7.4]
MRNPYQRKATAKAPSSNDNVKELYKQFIENMVAQGSIVALYQEGWAMCTTPTGQRGFAIWQSKSLAKLMIKDTWADYQVQEISLKNLVEQLIPYLRQQKTTLAMDLTPDGHNLMVLPEKFLLDLKNYLYQLYLQKPEQFQSLKLPLPRHIRLN